MLSDRRVGCQRPRLELVPADQTGSAGGEAAALAETCGLVLDDWQRWTLDRVLGERSDGAWSASQSLIILPRQNGKNSILEAVELAGLFLFDEQQIIHTAHLGKTAADHMRRMVSLIKANPELESLCTFYWSNGKEAIVRDDTGARIEFVTRGKGTARGGSPSRIVFDEALFLSDDQIQAILPALSAQSLNVGSGPQIIYTSSAPLASSEVLHRLRHAGRTGTARGLFYAEWSAPTADDPSDVELWYQANPGLGIRISEDWVRDNELATLSPEAFAIERLGVVLGEDAGTVNELAGWADCLDAASTIAGNPTALVADVAPDLSWFTIGVAGRRSDGICHVEIVDRLPSRDDAVKVMVSMAKNYRLPVWVDPRAAVSALIPELLAARVDVQEFTTAQLVQACALLKQLVADKQIRHRGQGPLDQAVQGAGVRVIGEGWAWGRRVSTVDISPLMVATFAAWITQSQRARVDVWVATD